MDDDKKYDEKDEHEPLIEMSNMDNVRRRLYELIEDYRTALHITFDINILHRAIETDDPDDLIEILEYLENIVRATRGNQDQTQAAQELAVEIQTRTNRHSP